ncbi:hypothetical protein T484DRAFT_2362343 [Baffinella frigidus]|nr:hypothetical protein T484DRAFT_2362343 [Cryptophyta sp. CCMP2293]
MSADVAETSFGRKHPPRTYKHGQVDMTNEAKTWFQLLFFRRGTAQVAAEEMEDAREWNDHYSPLQPEKYIAFRVMAMLEFYKGRIPSYSFSRELMSGLLMASSAAGAIIAFTWMPEYPPPPLFRFTNTRDSRNTPWCIPPLLLLLLLLLLDCPQAWRRVIQKSMSQKTGPPRYRANPQKCLTATFDKKCLTATFDNQVRENHHGDHGRDHVPPNSVSNTESRPLKCVLHRVTTPKRYVAIITAITAGIMSWMEFSNVSKKLSRYNGSVVELEKVLLWWNHITPVDRASPIQIEKLVFLCEKVETYTLHPKP